MNLIFRVVLFCFVIGWRIVTAQDLVELSGSLPEALSAQSYLVVGDIFVSPGSSVSIEAGTVFLFESFTGLHVQGTVYVKGDEDKPVIFTSKNDKQYNLNATVEAAPFDWNGIDVYESALGSLFERCIIRFSVYGIRSQTEHFKVINSIFSNNGKSDMTIKGERQDITSQTPFSYGLPPPVEEPVKLPQPQQIAEVSPQKADPPVPAIDSVPRKRAGIQIMRYTGLALGVGAGAASVWYFVRRFQPAQEWLEELSTLDDDEKWRYSSKDWNAAEKDRNRKLGLCIAGTGGALLGVGVFSISFAF